MPIIFVENIYWHYYRDVPDLEYSKQQPFFHTSHAYVEC